jgi:4a-hydroxytetrahydrobiopterin dehydratase
MTQLKEQRCQPCEGGVDPLDRRAAENLLPQAPGWQLDEGTKEISRTFEFKNFHQTIGFVNAVAWIANREDHHPDLEVGYRRCRVRYSTHAIGGLSMNDFICAAKINALIDE